MLYSLKGEDKPDRLAPHWSSDQCDEWEKKESK
jgi:hypothetical protein